MLRSAVGSFFFLPFFSFLPFLPCECMGGEAQRVLSVGGSGGQEGGEDSPPPSPLAYTGNAKNKKAPTPLQCPLFTSKPTPILPALPGSGTPHPP